MSKNGRCMVTLEDPLYRTVRTVSKLRGLTISRLLRDLIANSLEELEEYALAKHGEEALRKTKKFVKHEDLMRRLGLDV